MLKVYKYTMSRVLGVVKVHANNKITIPKELREHLEIEDGTYVKFTLEGDKVIVKRLEP